MAVTVRANLCPQTHPCPSVRVGPVGALSQEGFAAPIVDKATKPGACREAVGDQTNHREDLPWE